MALLLGQLTPINEETGQPLAGASVVVSNPALATTIGNPDRHVPATSPINTNSLYMNIYEIFPGPHLDKQVSDDAHVGSTYAKGTVILTYPNESLIGK